jgi:hypothetical protein
MSNMSAYDHLAPNSHPTRVGVQAFRANVNRGGRNLQDADIGYQQTRPNGDVAQMTRHRSGSITESHFTPGPNPGTHNSYHYSVTTGVVTSVRGQSAGGQAIQAAHTSGQNV